jgi:hypothetical protein
MVMINRLINFLNDKYKAWHEKRFLKKHGVSSWASYNHQYDTDINWRADEIKHFYHGYPYVYCFEDSLSIIYKYDLYLSGPQVVCDWAESNMKHKYRFDFHRVCNKSLDDSNSWIRNEIGGRDLIFAAFKNKKDYTMFVMKMS